MTFNYDGNSITTPAPKAVNSDLLLPLAHPQQIKAVFDALATEGVDCSAAKRDYTKSGKFSKKAS